MAMPFNGITLEDISLNGNPVYRINHVHNDGSPVTVWKHKQHFIITGTIVFRTTEDSEESSSGCKTYTDYYYGIDVKAGNNIVTAVGISEIGIQMSLTDISGFGWWWTTGPGVNPGGLEFFTQILTYNGLHYQWNNTSEKTKSAYYYWSDLPEGSHPITSVPWSGSMSDAPHSYHTHDSGISFNVTLVCSITTNEGLKTTQTISIPCTIYLYKSWNIGDEYSVTYYKEVIL